MKIKNAIITEKCIMWVDELGPHQVGKDHPAYPAIEKAVMEGATAEDIKALIDKHKNAVVDYSLGKVAKVGDNYHYQGRELNNKLVKKIKEVKAAGYAFENLEKFLCNLFDNTSMTSRESLYDFMENKGLPITEDGCFLAYKAVRSDYTDKHTGTVSNKPGAVVEMERRDVDDNRGNHCSYGYHVGSMEYVRGFAYGDDRIVLCKVNPADVVSVPLDGECQKCRVCRYEVLDELSKEACGVVDRSEVSEIEAPYVGADGEDDQEQDWDDDGFEGRTNDRAGEWNDWEDEYLLEQHSRGTSWVVIADVLRRRLHDVMERATALAARA